jgi:hypothetical protein
MLKGKLKIHEEKGHSSSSSGTVVVYAGSYPNQEDVIRRIENSKKIFKEGDQVFIVTSKEYGFIDGWVDPEKWKEGVSHDNKFIIETYVRTNSGVRVKTAHFNIRHVGEAHQSC